MREILFLLTMLLSLSCCNDNAKLLEEISRLQKNPVTLLEYDKVLRNYDLDSFSDNEVKQYHKRSTLPVGDRI